MAPAVTAEPGKAPASKRMSASAALILPSFVTPILTLILPPGAGPDPSNTLRRSITIFTGRWDFLDSTAATGGRYTTVLPPKPPPISTGFTFMRDSSTLSMAAVCDLTPNAPCVLDQIVMRSSSSQNAVALCNSM